MADHTIPRLGEEDLQQLVMDLVRGDIFVSASMSPDSIPIVFPVVALGGFSEWTMEELSEIGVLYEYYSKAGNMSVNGLPMFWSCRYMHKEDWKIVRERAKVAIQAAETAAKG